jgi:hypothetical protein
MKNTTTIFKIGDMVAVAREPDSIGYIYDIESYSKERCTYVFFLSGANAGRKLLYDNCNIIPIESVVSDDKDEPVETQIIKEEPAVVKKQVSKTAKKKWSKTEIVAMIKEKPGAVDRGVLCLHKHESLIPEKSRSFVAYWANYVKAGKPLSGKHLINARRTCYFNAKVLLDAANGVL